MHENGVACAKAVEGAASLLEALSLSDSRFSRCPADQKGTMSLAMPCFAAGQPLNRQPAFPSAWTAANTAATEAAIAALRPRSEIDRAEFAIERLPFVRRIEFAQQTASAALLETAVPQLTAKQKRELSRANSAPPAKRKKQ